MPPLLITPASIEHYAMRLRKLTPRSQPRWGTLRPESLLPHMRTMLEISLEERTEPDIKIPLAHSVLFRWAVLNLPWPKGRLKAPDSLFPQPGMDMDLEREELIRVLDRFAHAAAAAPDRKTRSPVLGPITLCDWSRLHARHLEHHLSQFGV